MAQNSNTDPAIPASHPAADAPQDDSTAPRAQTVTQESGDSARHTTSIQTDGGAYVQGDVAVGGDLIGRDQNIYGDRVTGTKITVVVQDAAEAAAVSKDALQRQALITGDYVRKPYEPETVLIPTGPFLMGSDARSGFEAPPHEVTLPPFRMGKYPVTNGEFEAFIKAEGIRVAPELGWDGQTPFADRLRYPVSGVTWHEALDYCDWLRAQTGRPYALPTEAHWEKAARTADGRLYPWGNAWQAARCNHESAAPTAVDAFPAQNEYGVYDMVGNVRQWTCTLWGDGLRQPEPRYAYPWSADERNDLTASDQIRRVWRGGGYADKIETLRCAARGAQLPTSRGVPKKRFGFRVMIRWEEV
ncbi:MAG: SUMF1/EgtB/PvdO family nonheme iron enzyme [Caldilineaceae bacterium]